ncbi:MAG TPA: lipocalin family protein [Steroidobacteraceae bacterium]|nr:lipocalin family protein [Steroidobacteraceae bacterium]
MHRTGISRLLLALALLAAVAGCVSMGGKSSRPLKAVPYVDLPRYMGGWFVIANIPTSREKDCVDSIEGYAMRPDGRIDNKFACRDGSFSAPMKRRVSTIATVYDTQSNAEWRVPLYRVLNVKYVVVDLDPNYRWAVVGHPSRRYGWILSRSRTLPDETYAGIMQRLAEQGYDTRKFQKVPQGPGGPTIPTTARRSFFSIFR